MVERTCVLDGCGRPQRSRGWCNMHWQRWSKYGDPTVCYQDRDTDGKLRWIAEAARSRSVECIEWPWALSPSGYGVLWWPASKARRFVTHVVLEQAGFPQPESPRSHALHSCDNPPCGNNAHLRWGSQSENMQESVLRQRHPALRLNPSSVREIRYLVAQGLPRKHIATMFGVSTPTISAVITGRNWGHVE